LQVKKLAMPPCVGVHENQMSLPRHRTEPVRDAGARRRLRGVERVDTDRREDDGRVAVVVHRSLEGGSKRRETRERDDRESAHRNLLAAVAWGTRRCRALLTLIPNAPQSTIQRIQLAGGVPREIYEVYSAPAETVSGTRAAAQGAQISDTPFVRLNVALGQNATTESRYQSW
jgi:hypothetical protein